MGKNRSIITVMMGPLFLQQQVIMVPGAWQVIQVTDCFSLTSLASLKPGFSPACCFSWPVFCLAAAPIAYKFRIIVATVNIPRYNRIHWQHCHSRSFLARRLLEVAFPCLIQAPAHGHGRIRQIFKIERSCRIFWLRRFQRTRPFGKICWLVSLVGKICGLVQYWL